MDKKVRYTTLAFIDIAILSCIFFGIPIWQSVSMYLTSSNEAGSVSFDMNTITDQMQWISIAQEIVLLGIAALYLLLRRFDFKVLQFKWNRWTLPLIAGLIVAGAAASDAGMWATQAIFPETPADVADQIDTYDGTVVQDMSVLPKITFMTVLFALMNGFFEEVFFMGLVFTSNKKSLPWALIFSVLVRFSFHIYQGIPAAVGITCMGLVFMLARTKIKSLVPFTLAHSFFDIFGVTLWFWICQVIC